LMSALVRMYHRHRVFVQVARGSRTEQLYSRLGFDICFERTGYHLRDWSPSPSVRVGEAPHEYWPRFLGAIERETSGESGAPQYSSHRINLPRELIESVEQLAARSELPPSTIWIGAWACLLSRYSNEVRPGFHICQPDGESQSPAPLLVDIDEQKPVSVWLRELADRMAGMKANVPTGDQLHYESILDFKSDPRSWNGRHRASLELRICREASDHIEVSYDCRIFEQESIRRLGGHLLTLAGEMATKTDGPLSELEIVTPGERRQLLEEWNRPVIPAEYRPLAELFEAEADHGPESLAVLLASKNAAGTEHGLSYEELNRRANQLAHYLRNCGVGPEVIVGLCLDRSLELIVSTVAVLKAGGVCLPLDPAYPAERLGYMLEDSGAAVVVAQRSALDSLPNDTGGLICLENLGEELARQPDTNPARSGGAGDAAYVIYTSGSTGRPKGVVITNGAISSHCLNSRAEYGLRRDDRVLQFNSFSFDAAFEQIFTTLISGATLVLRGPEVWSPAELAREINRLNLTVVDLPTAYWHQALAEWTRDRGLIPPVPPRLFIAGGEAMQLESLHLWRQLPFGGTRLLNAYGPTEATITASTFEVTTGFVQSGTPRRVPIGKARGERDLYILDSLGRLVPVGVAGEIHIGGPLLARGYMNLPELTAQKFYLNPYKPGSGERLYRTGDLGRFLPDGQVEFLGRVDDQVKIRGYRIELGEIATALRNHPDVREAVVVLRSLRTAAESRLVAYCVANSDQHAPETELRAHLRRSLPEYMLPAAFVFLETFPLLPGGKIDKRALPDPPESMTDNDAGGPRDPVELRIKLLFERVLRRGPAPVDRSFFELGGDSLQALELIMEIERMCGRELGLETLYRSSTVEALARSLRETSIDSSSLVPLQTVGHRPPLFFIHTTPGDILGYGNLIYHLDREQPCYGFQSLGFYQPDMSHTRIEEMAAYYIGLMRDFQKEGPYYLAGWCYGGIVAYEMARQLSAVGERAAFLGLMETVAPRPSLAVYRYYLHRIGCILRMKPAHWRGYLQEKIRYRREFKLAIKMRFRQLEKSQKDNMQAFEQHQRKLALLEHVYNTNMAALEAYRPAPHAGRVTLFNAEETDPGMLRDPLYAWRGLAEEIEIQTVPGKHDTMLMEPHVAVLARKLDMTLRQAQGTALAATGRERKPRTNLAAQTK
jgi:amino acid adenylation domain-containing protein